MPSPLESNQSMASKTKAGKRGKMPDGGTLLGWSHMVAPINQTKNSKKSSLHGEARLGGVQQCIGGSNATPEVPPDLHFVLRSLLQQQGFQAQAISAYLADNPSIKRYNSAFKELYSILCSKGINPMEASTNQVVESILQLNTTSVSQARNAYSAVMLLPNMGGVRFNPLLSRAKRAWNTNVEKYGSFWDCQPALSSLAVAACKDATTQQPAPPLPGDAIAGPSSGFHWASWPGQSRVAGRCPPAALVMGSFCREVRCTPGSRFTRRISPVRAKTRRNPSQASRIRAGPNPHRRPLRTVFC